MGESILLREDHGAVARITLNRPGALNALSDEMLAALRQAFADLATDKSIRVVILAGAGKAFCAGHDLKEMQAARDGDDQGAAYFLDLFTRCGDIMQMIPALPQPVIAQAHGIATAAGCQLVASCDMAVAASGTRFGVNGVNIGLFCSTPMVALSRNIPRKFAFEMLSTGEFIDAKRAYEVGLVNRVVAPEALTEATMELAQTVAAKLGRAVKIGKQAFYAQAEMGLAEAYRFTGQVMAENMMYSETAEGVQAFIEKRPPEWSQD